MATQDSVELKLALWRGLGWENMGVTFSLMAMKSTYSFDPTHKFVAEVNALEITATGYARKNLSNSAGTRLLALSGATLQVKADATPIVFGPFSNDGGGQVIGGFWLFKSNGSAATDELLRFYSGGNAPNVLPWTILVGQSFDFRKTDGIFATQ